MFNVALALCIKDCVKIAYEKFPHIDWVELGKEVAAVEALKEVKARKQLKDGVVGTPK